MSKPDDIPQDVWQVAQNICDQAALPEHYYTQGVVTALQTDIARAIMADREARRPKAIGGLTAHQKRVFEFIRAYATEKGVSPSYDEIKDFLGINSKSGVHRVIHELADRGVIAFIPARSRGITVMGDA